jgi:hypothetical protein
MKYVLEMASGGMINIPDFMTIGSGIQVILRAFDCGVGITDGRDS